MIGRLFAGRTALPPSRNVEIEGVALELVRKRIRYINLSVHPPDGRVRVAAPLRASEDDIRSFIRGRKEWIERQRERVRRLPIDPPAEYETGEIHFFQGETRRLERIEIPGRRGRVEHDAGAGVIRLFHPAGTDRSGRQRILFKWYRDELARLVPPALARWENVVGVEARSWSVRSMRTKWGTCNTRSRHICVALELVKRPPSALDYIMVHELTHLLERGHGPRFKGFMDRFMPEWREQRSRLRAPQARAQTPD